MIQRTYLNWYKHKFYFHTHWQLFLLQMHPYIVWYILQMALFLFCHIISYVVKTNLWYRDLVKTARPKLKISKFVHFGEFFQKIIISTLKLNFFYFWHFSHLFWLVVSYLLIQQRKNSLNYRNFIQSYPCNIDSFKTTGLWPRPVTFESKMRPETFKTETETRKNGLKTSSLQIIQQSYRIKTVAKFIDLQSCLSFHGPTISHGCLYARHARYKQFNSNEILPNINLM